MTAERPTPRTLLEQLIRDMDATQEEICERYNKLADRLGEKTAMSVRHLQRLAYRERPDQRSSPSTGRVMRELFGFSMAELLGEAQPDRGIREPENQPGTAEPGLEHDERQHVLADVRATLGRPPPLWLPGEETGDLQPADDAAIIAMVQEADRTDIGPNTIEGLYAVFDRLCREYPSADTRDLRRGLKRLYSRVMQLRQGRITYAQHREVIALAGWVTALLACVEWDMNQREAAETARSATARFAKEIGHGELTAWSYEIQAWFSLTEGRYSDVTNIARAGQEVGGENSAVVQLIMQEARGLSRLGDRCAAESAIDRGHSLLQKLPAVNYPRHFVFDRTKFPFYAASCHQWFGDNEEAEKLANQVIRQCEANGTAERSPMRLAEVHITLGLIHASQSDPAGALDHGTQALTYQRKSGPTLLTQAKELNKAIKERFPRSRQAVEYEERLYSFLKEFGLDRRTA